MASRKSTTTGEEIPDAFLLDYAPTGRAACKKCGSNIGDGSVRVAKKVRSRFHDGFDLQYMHWRCGKDSCESLDGFMGWQSLKWSDIQNCLQSKDELVPSDSSEAIKSFKKRNQWVIEAAGHLAAAPISILKSVLEANAITFSDKAKGLELATVLADQLLFGRLPTCPVCNTNSIRQEGTDFRCHGWFSSSTKCTFRFRLENLLDGGPSMVGGIPVGDSDMQVRLTRGLPPTLTEEAESHKVFKTFKVPKEVLVERKKREMKSGSAFATASTGAGISASACDLLDSEADDSSTIPYNQWLLGLKICFLGAPDKEMLTKRIEACGGTVQSDLEVAGRNRTTHLVIGEDELDKDPKGAKYRAAVDAGIPIVFEKFIMALTDDDKVSASGRSTASGTPTTESAEISENPAVIRIYGRSSEKKNSSLNGDYILDDSQSFNDKPVWKKAGSKNDLFVFCCVEKNKWKINAKVGSDCGQLAYNKDWMAKNPIECSEAWSFFDGKDAGFNADNEVGFTPFSSEQNAKSNIKVESSRKALLQLNKGLALRQRKLLRKYLVDGALGKKLPKIADIVKEQLREQHKHKKRPAPVTGSPLLTVDEECSLSGADIFVDEKNNAYNAYLVKTDSVNNVNKFYTVQLLVSGSNKDRFSVFRKWGRVGGGVGKINDSLISKHRHDLRGALDEFDKKFQELTGYKFSERDGADQKPGRYGVVELSGQDDLSNHADKKAKRRKVETDVPCQLPPAVRLLIETIFDSEMVEHQMMKQMDIDTSQLPLHALSKRQIEQGLSVLKEIMAILNTRAEENLSSTKSGNITASHLLDLRLRDATNRYFTMIPHKFCSKSTVPVLDSERLIKKESRIMEDLLSIVDFNTVKAEASHLSGKHIYDSQYEKLGCTINPVDPGHTDFDWISRYVKQTHATTHNTYKLDIVNVLAVGREKELLAYNASPIKHNKQMLWHGSRITNWVSILSQGLRIAPKEAPVTGYMFGKGVYFADVCSKSANYCFASPDNPYGVLALCEVALGDPYMKLEAEYEADSKCKSSQCHSTWGVGQSAPSVIEPVSDDVLAPLGVLGPNDHNIEQAKKLRPKEKPSLLYNEFIVYNTSQVKIKYLVFVKFDFSTGDENLWD